MMYLANFAAGQVETDGSEQRHLTLVLRFLVYQSAFRFCGGKLADLKKGRPKRVP